MSAEFWLSKHLKDATRAPPPVFLVETTDPEVLNHFASHPDIAPHIGGAVDFSNAIRPTARFLFGEYGGFCLEWTGPGVWEAHVMLTREGRGEWGFEAGRGMLRMMDADLIWARIAERHVGQYAARIGFAFEGEQVLYTDDQPTTWRIYAWRRECLPQ